MKIIEDRSIRVINKVMPVQIEAILNMFFSQQLRGCKLKKLDAREADLSGFFSELLLGAIRRLEKIDFGGTTSTAEQLNAILSMVGKGRQGNLKSINIDNPNIMGAISS